MDMQKYVVELLKSYNPMKQEIEALQYELTHLVMESSVETIEAMTFSPPAGEFTTGGTISNKTPDIALNYAQKNEEFRKNAICEITTRLYELCEATDRLDFYIEKLPAHQASILREYYFEGYSWRELQELRGVTYKTLITHRNHAVKLLAAKYGSLERLKLL